MFYHPEQHYPDRVALIDERGLVLTYKELAAAADQIAANLTASRLVFIFCTNTPGMLCGYLACLRAGAVPLMLDAGLDRQRIDELIEIYHPDLLWQPAAESAIPYIYQAFDYQLVPGQGKPFPLHPSLALLMSTSGSTGSPKLVRLSRRNLQSNAQSIANYLELNADERPLVHLPLHYVYGLSIVNSHLQVGATLILTQSGLMQREFWQGMEQHQVTSLAGVPYTFEMMHKLRFSRMSLPSLRTLTQAGGKLSPQLQQHFAESARQNGRKFIVMYGAAEATSRMAWLPPELAILKCGSIGFAIPGGELHLVDDAGQKISEPEREGELVYSGENVMLGYATSGNDLVRGDELKGTLHTGDIARFDREGCFTLVGRKKRFLKIFGNRVSLDQMEMLLKNHFEGLECACDGCDDRLTLFLTDPGLADEVKGYAAAATRLHPSAFHIKVINSIPRTASGKTDYRSLKIDEIDL